MIRVVSENLWDEISELAKRAAIKYAAIAYVSSDVALQFGKGDVLICDASDNAIKTAQTSVSVLKKAYKHGAELYCYPGLHAKLLYLDGYAVIGSANLSQNSAKYLFEAAIITDQLRVVQQTVSLIDAVKEASVRVDGEFLDRVANLPVERTNHTFPHQRRKQVDLKPHEPQTWLVGTYDDPKVTEDQTRQLDAGLSDASSKMVQSSSKPDWFIETVNTNYRQSVKPGDHVIYLWREKSTHRKPQWAYKPCPVLQVIHFKGYSGIYTETFKNAEKTKLSSSQFLKLAKQVGIRFPIGINADRILKESQADTLEANWKDYLK